MIHVSKGLSIGLIILELLRQNEELSEVSLNIGTFTNCRECGLTFMLADDPVFTWCVYEHRNSDQIIINGKAGFISMNGDLPYAEGSKWGYLAAFSYNEYYEAAEELARMILKQYRLGQQKAEAANA